MIFVRFVTSIHPPLLPAVSFNGPYKGIINSFTGCDCVKLEKIKKMLHWNAVSALEGLRNRPRRFALCVWSTFPMIAGCRWHFTWSLFNNFDYQKLIYNTKILDICVFSTLRGIFIDSSALNDALFKASQKNWVNLIRSAF